MTAAELPAAQITAALFIYSKLPAGLADPPPGQVRDDLARIVATHGADAIATWAGWLATEDIALPHLVARLGWCRRAAALLTGDADPSPPARADASCPSPT